MTVRIQVPVYFIYHLDSVSDAFRYQMWGKTHINEQRYMAVSNIMQTDDLYTRCVASFLLPIA